jgi:hypothetical protein|tara:strand:+ start:104 stop:349 length:246 start_codon:yes stop_codon:yes gene_type:complete
MLSQPIAEKCKKASFVELADTGWVRVDGYDEDEGILYVHNEDTGDEYSLDTDIEFEDAIFYEITTIEDSEKRLPLLTKEMI